MLDDTSAHMDESSSATAVEQSVHTSESDTAELIPDRHCHDCDKLHEQVSLALPA